MLEWVAMPSSGALPDPRIEPASPALQADSLLSEPPTEQWRSVKGQPFNMRLLMGNPCPEHSTGLAES